MSLTSNKLHKLQSPIAPAEFVNDQIVVKLNVSIALQ